MRTSGIWQLVLVTLFVALGPAYGYADIVFHEGIFNIGTDQNLQFNDALEGGPATTIQGLTNTSATLVDITRIDPDPILLVKDAAGQARVEATDPVDTALFSGALFETVGSVFTAFEFNVLVDEDGFLEIFAKDLDGIVHSSADQAGFSGAVSSSGENRFGVTAVAGQKLVSVEVRLNGVIVQDIRQVRFGSIAAVPEPASFAISIISLVALGLFCCSRYMRRFA